MWWHNTAAVFLCKILKIHVLKRKCLKACVNLVSILYVSLGTTLQLSHMWFWPFSTISSCKRNYAEGKLIYEYIYVWKVIKKIKLFAPNKTTKNQIKSNQIQRITGLLILPRTRFKIYFLTLCPSIQLWYSPPCLAHLWRPCRLPSSTHRS